MKLGFSLANPLQKYVAATIRRHVLRASGSRLGPANATASSMNTYW